MTPIRIVITPAVNAVAAAAAGTSIPAADRIAGFRKMM